MTVPFPIEPIGDDPGGPGGSPTPTPTPTPTPSPTPTPTPTPTPSPTPGPTPTPSVIGVISAQVAPVTLTLTTEQIPLAVAPSQTLAVRLGAQACTLRIYQKSTGLFLDLLVSDRSIIAGALCQDRNRLVRDGYHGFVGDLAFVDTQGRNDPSYDGFGGRFVLLWISNA